MTQESPNRTPLADAFTQLILETFRFNGQLLAVGDNMTRKVGLTSALWQVLGAIRDKPLPVAQIARNMGLTRQSVQRTANVLKKKGLVEFKENPDHKRAKLVVLTKPGREALDQITTIQIDWSNTITAGMNEAELNRACHVLKTLSEKLQGEKNDSPTIGADVQFSRNPGPR